MPILRPVYPFSALVGQERLKRALVLNAINPRIGGVLIRGEKGTAKSTAVRALAGLLPSLTVVADCPYQCAPDEPASLCATCTHRRATHEPLPTLVRPTRLVELPVSASEDRVVGALDLEHAITEGQRRFEPGLLAQVNRGLLYVDEVNLLDDHLVDILLDAAAMGVNTVEREGISISHPARFMLVGTMNPEEGELRPQLLDRFGLAVEVTGLSDVPGRVAVIERRMAYEADPELFVAQWQAAEQALAQQIVVARELLPQVHIAATDMSVVARLAIELGVDGHRADLTILETARTHAALSGRLTLTTEDIRLAAELALPHRMRRQPFAEIKVDEARIKMVLEQSSQSSQATTFAQDEGKKKDRVPELERSRQGTSRPTTLLRGLPDGSGGDGSYAASSEERATGGVTHQSDPPFPTRRLEGQNDWNQLRRLPGRRTRTRTRRKQGHYIASTVVPRVTDLALDATLREAAPYQRRRHAIKWATSQDAVSPEAPLAERSPGVECTAPRSATKVILHRSDLRQKIRVRRTRNAVCFVVDASWSMAADERMRSTKAAVLSLLHDVYQRRDRVGLVSFQRSSAHILLPLTNSVDLAQRCLQTMPTGGKTPLARGLLTGYEVLSRACLQDNEVIPLLVLLTDGQANVSMTHLAPQFEAYRVADFIASHAMRAIVIDTEHPHFERGLARQLAQHLNGIYYRLEELDEGGLAQMVRAQMKNTQRA